MKAISRSRALYIRGAVLAALIIGWLCVPSFKSWLSGMVMLFTQRSVQSLQGNINTAAFPVLSVFKQSAFHSAVMFFLPPRQIVAAAACLGPVMGIAASMAGSMAGAAAWYWLLYPVLKKPVLQDKLKNTSPWLTSGLTGLLGGIWGPIMGISALLKLPFLRCAAGVGTMGLAVTLMYALLCSPFSALLPSWAMLCLRICGTAILAFSIWKCTRK